jgi:UPF0716 family protein affecting phage T7 exclusion
MSEPQAFGMISSIIVYIIAGMFITWPYAGVVTGIYALILLLIWIYSPYVHKLTLAQTAPQAVKEQDWGFDK